MSRGTIFFACLHRQRTPLHVCRMSHDRDGTYVTTTLKGTTKTLQKIVQEIGNSVREATATSNQLSKTAATYKEALLSMNNQNPPATAGMATRSQEDPGLTRDLD
ncbi:hypothetical protein EI94DRAFT_1704371 [Lactarius quietus]|nr:hypothetical protein EI94DRAFT_1704371 [Lactarius quietus]